jgi:acetylornithine deacetylase/succinyl-diaminopimelate desuccinylase-like protein
MIDKLEKRIEENLENALKDSKGFVRIPSIAAKNQGIVEAAEFLKAAQFASTFRTYWSF